MICKKTISCVVLTVFLWTALVPDYIYSNSFTVLKGYLRPPGNLINLRNENSGVKQSLRIMEIGNLYPHEETIPDIVKDLRTKIAKSGVFSWPIIVHSLANGKGLVIDGMHRLAAMKTEYQYIPALQIDLNDEAVKLDIWARRIDGIDPDKFKEIIKRFNLAAVREEIDQQAVILYAGLKYTFKKFAAAESDSARQKLMVYEQLCKLEKDLGIEKKNPQKAYLTREAADEIKNDPNTVVIFPPKLRKEEVIALGQQGRLLPPKSTRFSIPYRVVNINVFLSKLEDGTALEKLNETFQDELGRLSIKHLGKGIAIDRLYPGEDLFAGKKIDRTEAEGLFSLQPEKDGKKEFTLINIEKTEQWLRHFNGEVENESQPAIKSAKKMLVFALIMAALSTVLLYLQGDWANVGWWSGEAWTWLIGNFRLRPLITTGLAISLGDIFAQWVMSRGFRIRKFDKDRWIRTVIFSFGIYGFTSQFFYLTLGLLFPGPALWWMRVWIDQFFYTTLLFHPLNFFLHISFPNIVEKKQRSWSERWQSYKDIFATEIDQNKGKGRYWTALRNNWGYWICVTSLIYSSVASDYWVYSVNIASIPWSVILPLSVFHGWKIENLFIGIKKYSPKGNSRWALKSL